MEIGFLADQPLDKNRYAGVLFAAELVPGDQTPPSQPAVLWCASGDKSRLGGGKGSSDEPTAAASNSRKLLVGSGSIVFLCKAT